MEKRDLGIGFGGLLTGLALVGGLLYYTGGWEAFSPVTSKGSEVAEKIGIRIPETRPAPRVTERPTSAPTPSPGPAKGSTGSMRVKLNNLTLHRCPGYDCEKIMALPMGAKVLLLGERDFTTGEEWCRVRTGSTEGWVSRYYLE